VTLVPEIRDQIHATAQRRVRSAAPTRRPARPWRRMAGSLTLAASVLVVAGVFAVILHVAHHLTNGIGQTVGQPAIAPPPAWGKLNAKALAHVQQQDVACRPQRLSGASSFRHDAPGQDLTSVLGVLRRPAPVGQRVSAHALLRPPRGRLDQFARGIYLRYVRHGQRNGITYYFIPAANVNQIRPVSDHCYREQLDAFRQLAAQRPANERASLTRYETRSLQEERAIAEHPAGVCLATTGAGGSGTGPCVNAVSVRQLNSNTGGGSYGNDHATVTALIVPDRVATVTAHYSPQNYPGRVRRPLTVTERAVQNLVIFALQGAWDPPSSLIYRSATGSVLWSITRP
jgi:hypothetical protein